MQLDWDFSSGSCAISMPGYIANVLSRFKHPPVTRQQDSPHAYIAPTYGRGAQYEKYLSPSPPLPPEKLKYLQQVIGSLLYYGRMIDSTILVALNTLASAQSQGTADTLDALTQLLNYCASHPDATICFHKSDMILHVTSDASYLSASGSRSRLGGYFFMSARIGPNAPNPSDIPPPFNAPVLVNSSIIKAIMSSAAEAELGGLFYNAKDACLLRLTLQDMGYPQPATPIETDNSCAAGIANNNIRQKRSKAMDMRFFWIRDRVAAGEFIVYWRNGQNNTADYYTKHHPTSHHRKMRPLYLHEKKAHSANTVKRRKRYKEQYPLMTESETDTITNYITKAILAQYAQSAVPAHSTSTTLATRVC